MAKIESTKKLLKTNWADQGSTSMAFVKKVIYHYKLMISSTLHEEVIVFSIIEQLILICRIKKSDNFADHMLLSKNVK